ncbi:MULTISPECIES: SDR family NAD(P)-dependent oxidoreductase [unclassified Nocardioides]|uniref:SDR family NAD(P)-dependent oxidoreductase n=1 Tax=Nocardioides sp. URHA0032 TaxID=1380388 RepID=UPI0006856FE7|nr:SDR family oxidoreductase [Nocardioides sp. URHA0032]
MELRYALAVVTGAGAGLGREVAVAMARRGTAVLVADRDPAAAEEAAGLVREQRVGGWAFPADVSEEADLRALADRARDLGGADVLVNNAGGWTAGDQYPAAPYDAWSRTLDLNLRAPMLLTQLFLEGLDQRRGPRRVGAVVNVASSAAVGTDGYGSPEYAAAKAGLIRLTTALSDPGTAARARVMAVVPGWIGLPRAQVEWAALGEDERARLGPLVPVGAVVRTVVDLVAHGRAGQVVELL